MSTEEQTLCPKCNAQFAQNNPPRLLTMCGHTFCQNCVRQFTVKKKLNNKYKVTCPFDRMSIQISSPNPASFPKNLSVINLVKKKFSCQSTSPRLSTISRCKSDSLRLNIAQQIIDKNFQLFLSQTSNIDIIEAAREQFPNQTCLLHQKPLEIVCVRDYTKICASCAIFGEHKGHVVKNVKQAQQKVREVDSSLRKISQKTQRYMQKIKSKQTVELLDEMVLVKKKELQKQIGEKFKWLLEQVIHAEQKTMKKLQIKIEQYRSRVQSNYKQKLVIQQKYKQWQQLIQEKLICINSEREEDRFKIGFKSDAFLQSCNQNVEDLNLLSNEIFEETEKILDNLAISSDSESIQLQLNNFCQFEDCTNSFLQLCTNTSRITNLINDEILLEMSSQIPTSNNTSFLNQKQTPEKVSKHKLARTYTSGTNILKNCETKLNRMRSSKKDRELLSPIKKDNSLLKSNRALLSGTQRSSLNYILKLREIPQKYSEKIQTIISGSSDTLDLTNAELKNEKVLQILECIKGYPITIAKFVRNKLTDEFISKSLDYLEGVVMLNLSRNELTEKSIQEILERKKRGKLKQLKSVMVSQNKIVERKNKGLFDELKKIGVNICT